MILSASASCLLVLATLALQSPTSAEGCEGSGECIAQANEAFSAGQSVEGMRSLIQGFDLAWEGDVALMAEAVLFRCAEHQPQHDEEAFSSICESFLDQNYVALLDSGNPDVLEVLAAAKNRVGWEEQGPPEAVAPECPSPPENGDSGPLSDPGPADEESKPAEEENRPDRRAAWLFGVGSVSALGSIPLFAIGSTLIVGAERTRARALQDERFLTGSADEQSRFVSEYDAYVGERRLAGGILIASGTVLAIGATAMFSVAATRRWGRSRPSKRAAKHPRMGFAFSLRPALGGGALTFRGRF